jgi:ABC-type lipoprotein release transport system permease subunit
VRHRPLGHLSETRQAALIAGTFGVLALLLSGIGVYAVTALAVSRRTRDMSIRMALGAQRRHIIRAIGTRVITLITAGVRLGLLGVRSDSPESPGRWCSACRPATLRRLRR